MGSNSFNISLISFSIGINYYLTSIDLYLSIKRLVFLEHPELGKACRANMEWLSKRVKAPFKASLNRQGLDHIVNRMQLQLGGEVRNFIN